MLTPTSLFKCLADETRLRCLVLLHQKGRLCVCELTQALDMLQPKISRHLALLRQSKILLDSREGQWVYYQINPELPQWVADVLEITAQQFANHPGQQEDLQRLQAMANRTDKLNCCE
ncbi:MAG: metalloregulator ArsR/SmtB family transcription factor [Methylovulum sp.]|uniref:metalloregulator ArsR/SmtB family transcription factor n=1 Tax=Methylovulum sp. TaxID=1916980 RepID=UPI0026071834|nr:metalloregulator ArsR/SmtB family transcription factor [Methylovulum sp.]MDD2722973.1 metalloregulator ArsR/SmtB family transcription factor [Methylovulum sp.]MDD5123286.1 metalloregulator ArsR/SmtB family transcription factor [Methylovulum sp.]